MINALLFYVQRTFKNGYTKKSVLKLNFYTYGNSHKINFFPYTVRTWTRFWHRWTRQTSWRRSWNDDPNRCWTFSPQRSPICTILPAISRPDAPHWSRYDDQTTNFYNDVAIGVRDRPRVLCTTSDHQLLRCIFTVAAGTAVPFGHFSVSDQNLNQNNNIDRINSL